MSEQSVHDDLRNASAVDQYIETALQLTRDRIRLLGLDDEELLDPESNIDQQVAMLRSLFLEAERSCLPFSGDHERFWRVIRARLQPVVLAYLTHEKFVQTLDAEARELRPDTLMQVYKSRLSNSDRFRSFFFDLDKKLKQEALHDYPAVEAPLLSESTLPSHMPRYDATDNTDQIQKNILSALEKKLQELEKKYNSQEKALIKVNHDASGLQHALQEKEARIASLINNVRALEEENAQLRLVPDVKPREADASASEKVFSDELTDLDNEQLLLKIESMERELASTSDAAYNAFMANSDLGILILFMLTSFKCSDHVQLAQEVIKSLGAFGLKTIVGMQQESACVFYPGEGVDASLQSRLRDKIGSKNVVETPYLMLFQDSCCILIQNPPKDDLERYERLKDNLATLMRGVQARYEAIAAELMAKRQKTQVDALIIRSHEVFQTFEKNLQQQKSKLGRVINMVGQEIRKNLDIAPGEQKSIQLNMDLRKLEESAVKLFDEKDLMDPAFKKNISRVAEGVLKKTE
jgi:uncharacterized coiled-coil protein SlyX